MDYFLFTPGQRVVRREGGGKEKNRGFTADWPPRARRAFRLSWEMGTICLQANGLLHTEGAAG